MDGQIDLAFGEAIQSSSGTWYHTLQRLGSGGSAITFLMVAGSGGFEGIPFAVKLFHRVSKPERRAEFLRETAFLRECDHPGVMRVFDEGTFRGEHPFVVAEYLPRTLQEVINHTGITTQVERLSFAVQLLNTLAFLGSLDQPVIHRDIKPQNIFIKGRACVLGDFGLMKRSGSVEEEDRGEAMERSVGPGMPLRYRSPDLVAYKLGASSLTPQSDVFQLGLVLAELFTGQNPERPVARTEIHHPVELDPLDDIVGGQGAPIRALISEMLEIDPMNRPTATDFLTRWRGIFMAAAREARAESKNQKVFE